MIPVRSHQDYSQQRGRDDGYYGIPAIVSFRTQQQQQDEERARSLEELNAASVLISLTPQVTGRPATASPRLSSMPPTRTMIPLSPPAVSSSSFKHAPSPLPSARLMMKCMASRAAPPSQLPTIFAPTSAFSAYKVMQMRNQAMMMNHSNPHRWSQTPPVVHCNPKMLVATVSSCEYESSVVSSSSSAAEPHSEYSSDASLVAVEEYTSPIASPLPGHAHQPQSQQQQQQDRLQQWYPGSVSLSLWEDDDFLSPLHCFMRRYCVEAFTASPEDVKTPRYGKSHGVRVVVGQVGIRCLYCKHRPVGRRPERAVCFPSSVRNIYHSIETWQRRHSLVCTDIAPWVKKSMTELMESSKSRAGGRRQYWEDSAMRLGMIDTAEGVRFNRVPGDLGVAAKSPKPIQSNKNTNMSTNNVVMVAGKENNSPTHGQPSQELVVPQEELPAEPIVRESDRQLVTDYLFLLMEQMQTCQFTESDRTGGRSKIKDNDVGFPGMQCLHCRGLSGLGRYFPSSVDALALANSDRNTFNHLQKCRRCPPSIKAELVRLSNQQSQCKNKRGLRKLFFKRVWGRIHGTKGTTTTTSSISC